MRETRKKEIGAYTYSVTQLGARQGARVLTRLTKMLGSAVGKLAGSGGGAALEAVFAELANTLSEADTDYLIDTFLPSTRVTGGSYGSKEPLLKDVVDEHFVGSYADLISWLVFALEVNYGSFLADLGLTVRGQSAQDSEEETAKDGSE